MMRPRVEPEYLLKLDTHKHTILMLCLLTVLMLKHFILIYIYIYIIALISPCHRGQVDGRLYARFGWDFIFVASLLEIVNGHETNCICCC